MTLKIDWSALQGDHLYVAQDCNGNILWSKAPIPPAWGTEPSLPSSDDQAVHADKMKMYAEDAAACREPWLLWQTKPVEGSVWSDLVTHPAWAEEREYRRKPPTAQPFVFPHLFVNTANKEKPYLVKVANSDFTHIRTGWMDDPRLPESADVLQPSVDIELSSDEFATLPEAVQFIANWWRRNSTPQN